MLAFATKEQIQTVLNLTKEQLMDLIAPMIEFDPGEVLTDAYFSGISIEHDQLVFGILFDTNFADGSVGLVLTDFSDAGYIECSFTK